MAATAPPAACGRCQRPLRGWACELRTAAGTVTRCLRCALRHRPLVTRSAVISIIVGTALTAINHWRDCGTREPLARKTVGAGLRPAPTKAPHMGGNIIARGDATLALAWKVPLTYAVPYCVATTGALLNARTKVSQARPPGEER